MRHFTAVLLVWLLALSAALADEPAAAPPVSPVGALEKLHGEHLWYSVYWSGIPAATTQLQVVANKDGTTSLFIKARTKPVVRLLYPVSTKIFAVVSNDDMTPLVYGKKGKEGWGNEVDRRLTFDHETNITTLKRKGRNDRTLEVPEGVHDPLSVLYWYRTIELPPDGRAVDVLATDGKRIATGTVTILGRERVTTDAGTFDTIKVEPVMEGIGGVFAKSPDAHLYIWLTDDERRMPVKIMSEVVVGSFTALLERVVPPTNARQAAKQP